MVHKKGGLALAEVLQTPDGKSVSDKNQLPVKIIGGDAGGGSSMRFIFGTSDPTPNDGQPGDVFLNTSTGDIFSNVNGTWQKQGNLRGPQGPEGPRGPEGPQGPPGFGTEEQYNEIISRLEALEGEVFGGGGS